MSEKIVREFLRNLSKNAIDRIEPLLADDVEWQIVKSDPSNRMDKSQILQMIKNIPELAHDYSIEPLTDGVTAQGERVAIEVETKATSASGLSYHNRQHFLFLVRNGQINLIKEYSDTQHTAKVFPASLS